MERRDALRHLFYSRHINNKLKSLQQAHVEATTITMAAAHQSASRILPKLAIAATATGGTIFTCHHFENQRRILDDVKSSDDGCKSSSVTGALSSLQSEYKNVQDIIICCDPLEWATIEQS